MIDNMFKIYRPPPSRRNGFKNYTFFTELGDLNFHLYNKSNSDAQLYNDILESDVLKQHFTGWTHIRCGYIKGAELHYGKSTISVRSKY